MKLPKLTINRIQRIIKKTLAIAEKQIYMGLRFKYRTLLNYLAPIITILMPIIILGRFFENNINFSPWTSQNYVIFIFIGYNILLMRGMITYIPMHMQREQYWKTLPALIIAPFNRYYLLFGYFLSEVALLSIPFLAFLIVLYIIWPISILTLLSVLLLFMGVAIVFAAIGLVLGVITVANENISSIITFLLNFIIWASCITYPFQLFPGIVQDFISFNPLYYLINFIRLTWLEDNIFHTVTLHFGHFIIISSSIILAPILAVTMFNIIYKKLGTSGY
ncbi:MAG: ABC transporter permease [Promethearchaeota archaeon]